MCGSVWSCPVCCSKVLAGRVDEIADALRRWDALGGEVAMVTLTMRHDRGQSLADLWDALSQAWRAATTGNRSIRDRWSAVPGWTRRVEVTHGENGWHVHVHALLYIREGFADSQLVGLAESMFGAWSARLQRAGLAVPDSRLGGLDVRRLDLADALESVAGYHAKGTYEAIALEVAGPGKSGRRRSRTPMQILRDLLDNGLRRDWALWHEWEAGSKGRRAITWKRGFRDALELQAPRDDVDLANEGEELLIVAVIAAEDLAQLRRHPYAYASALVVVENSTPDDAYDRLCRWFDLWGLSRPLRPPILGCDDCAA
jgi:hypothetical protein